MVGEVTKKLEDGGLKGGIGVVDDIKNKLGKPGANPADDVDPITGKKKIPCYSSLGKPNNNLLDYALIVIGVKGISAEAKDCGIEIPEFDNLVEYGQWVSKNLNNNSARVKISGPSKLVNGSVVEELDLTGASHFEKSTGQNIPTPHVKVTTYIENTNPATGQTFLNSTSYVRPATKSDIDIVVSILKK